MDENMIQDVKALHFELRERKKELQCLYQVQELFKKTYLEEEVLFNSLLDIMPSGWQFPELFVAEINLYDKVYCKEKKRNNKVQLNTEIFVYGECVGEITAFYKEKSEIADELLFLPEEYPLIKAIAEMISQYLFSKKLTNTIDFLKIPPLQNKNGIMLSDILVPVSKYHSEWRMNMSKLIANKLEFEKFGVKAFYIIGSTKNMTCGPASDIDILIHYNGDLRNKEYLNLWFDGWSLCLAELNYIRTGYHVGRIIDLHLVTDEEVKNRENFAYRIGSINDPAKKIK